MSEDSQEAVAGRHPVSVATVSEKGQEQDGSHHHQDAVKERNKKIFAKLNREQVLELLDAFNLSQYREAFEENEIDGDLLIRGCDDSALEKDLGISSSLHQGKLMRLITGEYSAEQYCSCHEPKSNPCSQKLHLQEPAVGQQSVTAVSEKEQEQDGNRHDAEMERNKNYFTNLNRQQVLELLDALKLSQYKEAFKENEIDGDLLIKGCDESVLETDLGISSLLHRRKLMRLITGEYSAEKYFNLCSHLQLESTQSSQETLQGSKSKKMLVRMDSGDQSTKTSASHVQEQTRSGEIQQGYEVLSIDEVPVELKSGIPDTRYSSVGIPKGLSPPPKRVISVIFHVLLSTEAWQWDDSTSRAHIRFGHHDLGNWKVNCGEIAWSREMDDTLTELELTLPIDKSILECGAPLPYAYAIYSGSLMSVGSPLEHLYGAPHLPLKGGEGDFATRCLVIPPMKVWKEDFHQYDTICYPGRPRSQVIPKANLTQIFIKAVHKIMQYPENTSYSIDSPEVMLKRCLETYLNDYCIELTSCDTSVVVGIDKTVDQIMHIYKCLSNQLLYYIHSKEHTSMPGTNIEKVMQGWLLETSRSLKETENPSRKRLISAAVIILCLRQLSRDGLKSLPIRSMRTLLRIVTLKPSQRTRQCPDYEHLCKYILPADKPLLSDAIHTLCNTVLKSRGGEEVEWFQALPLYHFLEGFTQPFGMLNFKTFSDLKFKATYGDLRKTIDTAAKYTDSNAEEGIIDRYYGAIKHLLDVDPLLVEILIYVCPAEELSRLFLLLPPDLAVAGVAKLVRDFLPKLPPQDMTNYFKTIINEVRMTAVSAQWPGDSYQERLYLIKACRWVFIEVIAKLQSTSQHSVELVNATICLVLYGLYVFTQLQDENSDREQQNVFRKLSTSLKAWVSQHLSVLARINLALAKVREEMKLWDSFLQLDCPSELVNHWEHAVENIMKERIAQVDDGMKVNLVCVPDLDSDHTQVRTTKTLEVAAAHAIQAMGPAEAVKNAEKILCSRLKHINPVFKILIDERFAENSLELSDLLEWNLWPCLIKHFGGRGSVAAENPKLLSCFAYHKVVVFHDHIQDGIVTIHDLTTIKENIEQMKQLLAAASIKKSITLDRRLAQLDCIQLYNKQVVNFHLHHHDLENEGILELKRDADTDLNLMKLSDVIDTDRYPPAFRCLLSTLHLREYVEDFYTLTVEHCSDLFLVFWKDEIATKRRRFRDLATLVRQTWQSTFEHCDKVISSLRTANMEITEAAKMFGEMEESHIHQEITELVHGFAKCTKKNWNDSWIQRVVKRIIVHRSLRQYSETAKSFLKLKECLGLNGEFQQVILLADPVTTSTKHISLRLRDNDEDTAFAAKYLKPVTEDSENLQLLQAFVGSNRLIAWLKGEFKDVTAFRNFVSVSVATGISQESILALLNLEIVGSAFGPLIYGLKDDCEADALISAWERVWKIIQKPRWMTTALVVINKQVEWFKEIKLQGSVETISQGQIYIATVMKNGVYHTTAGTSELEKVHKLHEQEYSLLNLQLSQQNQANEILQKECSQLHQQQSRQDQAVKLLQQECSQVHEQLLQQSQAMEPLQQECFELHQQLLQQNQGKELLQQENLQLYQQLLEQNQAKELLQQECTELHQQLLQQSQAKELLQQECSQVHQQLSKQNQAKDLIQQECSQLHQQLSKQNQAKDLIQQECSQLHQQLSKQNQAKDQIQQECSQLHQQLSKQNQETNLIQQECSRLHQQLSKQNQAKILIQQECSQLYQQLSNQSQAKDLIQQECSQLHEQLAQKNQEKKDLKQECSQLQQQLLQQEQASELLQLECSQSHQQLLQQNLENKVLKQECSQLQQQLSQQNQEGEVLKQECSELQEQLSQQDQESKVLKLECSQLQQQQSHQKQENEILKQECSELQKQISEQKQEKGFLQQENLQLHQQLSRQNEVNKLLKEECSQSQQQLVEQSEKKKLLEEQRLQMQQALSQQHQVSQELQEKLEHQLMKMRSKLQETNFQHEQEKCHFQEEYSTLEQQLIHQREAAAETEEQYHHDVEDLQQRLDNIVAEMQQLRSSTCTQVDTEDIKISREEIQILSEIDRGAWGYVAKGRFRGQLVAVKSPHPAILDEQLIKRLEREVRIMTQVRHPNLLRILAAVFDGQVPDLPPLIITELLDMNLRAAYKNKQLPDASRISIFQDVAYALHYLHNHQEPIIHRDVSAPNVLLQILPNSMFRAKVSDFGSANLAKLAQSLAEGAIIYAAPETFPLGHDSHSRPPPQTTKIDVYSYGVLLCEVITCQLPDPRQFYSMLQKVQRQWACMHDLIVSCTKRSPEERLTMAQVLDTLHKLPNPQPHQRS